MEKVYMILLLVIIPEIMTQYHLPYYCNIRNCANPRAHTLCRYNPSALGNQCNKYHVVSTGVNSQEVQQILQKHNQLRQYVASGHETRGFPGPQPPASNMAPLSWDNELAQIAQTWANQCRPGHDECRNVGSYQVGQNVADTPYVHRDQVNIVDGIQRWYNEVYLFNKGFVNNYRFNLQYGHYSQVVWALTTRIGCGQITYYDGQFYTQKLVCNYGPSGNFIGQKVYEVAGLYRG